VPTSVPITADVFAAKPGKIADVQRKERDVMPKIQTLFLALLGFVAFAFQSPSDARASTLLPGSSHQFEDHSGDSGDNHSNQTLDGIDLSFGSFANTNLRNSILIAGVFVQTDFSGANLSNVNLQNANLTDATFSPGTNLNNSDLTGANLIGIDLTGVNVRNAILIGAIYDSSTVLPFAFDPVARGMVPIPETSPLLMMMLGLMTLSAWPASR
jgi:hypothetical protein